MAPDLVCEPLRDPAVNLACLRSSLASLYPSWEGNAPVRRKFQKRNGAQRGACRTFRDGRRELTGARSKL